VTRSTAAKRYAEALLQLAKEQGQLEEWAQQLEAVAQMLGHPQVAEALDNARLPPTRKLELVEGFLEGLHPLVLNLVRLLVERGRARLAPAIAQAYRELADRERGIVHALVKTAVPLAEEEKEALVQRLQEATGQQVVLHTEVDEGIIGGLVIRIGDRLIDGSTRSQLLALKRRLQEARA
jgi:F-type H+-transporting ATPase subunit delta